MFLNYPGAFLLPKVFHSQGTITTKPALAGTPQLPPLPQQSNLLAPSSTPCDSWECFFLWHLDNSRKPDLVHHYFPCHRWQAQTRSGSGEGIDKDHNVLKSLQMTTSTTAALYPAILEGKVPRFPISFTRPSNSESSISRNHNTFSALLSRCF